MKQWLCLNRYSKAQIASFLQRAESLGTTFTLGEKWLIPSKLLFQPLSVLGAVVVAQLVEWLVPTPEVRCLIPIGDINNYQYSTNCNLERTKIKQNGSGKGTSFKKPIGSALLESCSRAGVIRVIVVVKVLANLHLFMVNVLSPYAEAYF